MDCLKRERDIRVKPKVKRFKNCLQDKTAYGAKKRKTFSQEGKSNRDYLGIILGQKSATLFSWKTKGLGEGESNVIEATFCFLGGVGGLVIDCYGKRNKPRIIDLFILDSGAGEANSKVANN